MSMGVVSYNVINIGGPTTRSEIVEAMGFGGRKIRLHMPQMLSLRSAQVKLICLVNDNTRSQSSW